MVCAGHLRPRFLCRRQHRYTHGRGNPCHPRFLPIYWSLYQSIGPVGLAIASDIGILIQTLTLAILLDRNRMVPFRDLEYTEVLRSLLAAIVSYPALVGLRILIPATSRLHELALLLVATVVWLAISAAVLRLTGSALPDQLLSRFGMSQSNA